MEIDIENIDIQELGPILRQRLNEKGLTLSDLANHLGVSNTLIALAITGRRRLSKNMYIDIINFLEIENNVFPLKSKEKILNKTKGEKIFISYCHKDHLYLDRLMVHLKPLEKLGLIDPWVDTRLKAGEKWKKEIEKALKSAKVGILLISADFLASDFIINNELPPMIQSAEETGTLIIPVILKPCRFLRDKNLREFQAINLPDEPLSLLDENERELIYDTIAQRIEECFDNNG